MCISLRDIIILINISFFCFPIPFYVKRGSHMIVLVSFVWKQWPSLCWLYWKITESKILSIFLQVKLCHAKLPMFASQPVDHFQYISKITSVIVCPITFPYTPHPPPSCCNLTMAPNQRWSERTFAAWGLLAISPGAQLSIRPHFYSCW